MNANSRYTKIYAPNADHIITRDETTGLEWSARDIGRHTNSAKGSEAEAACVSLQLGGFNDWRLPTVEELESIRDRSRFDPAIDTDAFPDCPTTWFWSSTPNAESPDRYAWVVGFYDGRSDVRPHSYNCCVRAVRSSITSHGAGVSGE
ncbi:DUF1566 domain-containing protein [Stenotrophomonas sp.]|uniref:Lcl C-terminal domain-containing protein n=1 Tax=Stenotrophomonas sp. TaxID=69392 RepID=UPI0028ACF2B1|nr:DUF1566 domain-containing protein [Stenotrophomonas sp.]